MTQEGSVCAVVVERHDCSDIFPRSEARRDTCSSKLFAPVDEVVDGKKILGLKLGRNDSFCSTARVVLGDSI
jgi:hypothetical protein